jgi:hypothetical protein
MIKKKELDIKSLVRDSLKSAVKQHGLVKETEEPKKSQRPSFNALDYVPALRINGQTFAKGQLQSPSDLLLRSLFDKFLVPGNIKETLKKIFQVLESDYKDYGSIQESFSALTIISLMLHVAEQEPKVSGHLFETILAGLVGGVTVGREGKTIDIVYKVNNIDFSISAKSVERKVGFEFKQGLKGLIETIKEKPINYFFVLKSEDGWEFFESVIDKNSFSEEGGGLLVFSPKTKSNYKEGYLTYYESLLLTYFSNTSDDNKKKIIATWNSQSSKNIDNFFEFTNRFAPLTEQKNIIKETRQGFEFKKIINYEDFKQKSKLVGTLIPDKQKTILAYNNMMKFYKEQFEILLDPIHVSMFYLNQFLINRNLEDLKESKREAEIYVNNSSNILELKEGLNDMTEEAKIVMEILKRMEG